MGSQKGVLMSRNTVGILTFHRALNYGAGGYQRVLEKCKGNTDK